MESRADPFRRAPVTEFLFIAALFLIFLLAMNFEFLLLPDLGVAVGGAACAVAGAIVLAVGAIRKNKADSAPSQPGKSVRSGGCAAMIAGGLYLLAGIGVLILQAVGYLLT